MRLPPRGSLVLPGATSLRRVEQKAAPLAEPLSLSGDPAGTRGARADLAVCVAQALRCLATRSSLERVSGRGWKCPLNFWVFTPFEQSPCKLRCSLFSQGI